MSLLRAMAAVGCMTGMVEGALRSSQRSHLAPQALEMMMQSAEEQWISEYRGALNGTANSSEALTDVRNSCVKTAFAMVDSVKGHKNGLSKRMHSVCKFAPESDDLCLKFSDGLLASISEDPTMNVDGKMDGILGAFCGHFVEAAVRPKAEARNTAAQDRKNKIHAREARIAATMNVVAKAQEEVKKAQKAQQEELKVAKPVPKKQQKGAPKQPSAADVEASKKAQLKKKQEAAEREGGAKGLAKELAREEESENGIKGQVVNDALAVETTKDEPLPKHPSDSSDAENTD